jgi:uncharacterized surface protein with fasciclin (FAS1) repeats
MSLIKNITTLSLLGTLAIAGLTSVSTFAHEYYQTDDVTIVDETEVTDDIELEEISSEEDEVVADLDIIGAAIADEDYSTLVAAVSAAGLVDTLKSADFTVLAPSNDAFGKLPADTVATLIKPENKATLTNILLYHVIAGRVNLAELEDGSKIKTVLGQELTVSNTDGLIQVTTAAGKTFDLTDTPAELTNGYIYGLDEVLIPS